MDSLSFYLKAVLLYQFSLICIVCLNRRRVRPSQSKQFCLNYLRQVWQIVKAPLGKFLNLIIQSPSLNVDLLKIYDVLDLRWL